MNGWQIATINRTDLEPIVAIEQLSFQWPWDRIFFECELSCQNACNYVLKSAGTSNEEQIVAYAFLRWLVDKLHILKIAVTPARRRHGLATWFLNRCLTMGAGLGANSAHLEVRPSNIAAVKFYEKLGFVASHEGFKRMLPADD